MATKTWRHRQRTHLLHGPRSPKPTRAAAHPPPSREQEENTAALTPGRPSEEHETRSFLKKNPLPLRWSLVPV
ncbi:hypothetical protein Y1Q_0002902 [Alligator mississippiensis]|uniref:Uncharacterized protein n=1 Tax=Alligator mississippiensis TaxID=8496 RepID=A0A151MCR9_ALLMI|nr:hypothetical protein Y1Q_0002902 [Alligator mississippiensis]